MTTADDVKPWTDDDFMKPDDEAGIPFENFAQALPLWAWMQNRTVSVAEAALAFNTSPDIIRRAFEDQPYAYLSGDDADPSQQFIEHDGE